ncbi:MAG: Ig-like domain-containing protein [Flavisolibacter sp.]
MAKDVSLSAMRKGIIASALVVIVCAFWMSVPTGCANMIPPSGGPRDSIPPEFINAIPHDSTVNFKGDRIVLTFNEELDDPKDPRNNIIFTPSFDVDPVVTTKGKTVTVKFKDTTLRPNTTYVINFGNSIVDLTEGNPVKNFTYTFSTGPYLDSLEISGKVLLAEGGIDTTLNMALYRDRRDSSIITKNPQYVVRLDRNGNFRFRNLPKDTFAIYAFGGGNRRYQRGQLFAFSDSAVVAGKTDSLVLYAYHDGATSSTTAPGPPATVRIPPNDRRLRLTPSTTSQQELLSDFTLTFPVPLRSFDSSKMHLTTDSTFSPTPFVATLDSVKKEVRLKTAWKEGTVYHLILDKDFAADTMARQLLKTDTISFITKKNADYGSLQLRFKNIDKYKHPVIQFVQNNQVMRSVPVKGSVYSEPLVLPGEFNLRVFDDLNENGKWDPGQFFGKKRQPELVHPIQRAFTIKANWDNEFEVVL